MCSSRGLRQSLPPRRAHESTTRDTKSLRTGRRARQSSNVSLGAPDRTSASSSSCHASDPANSSRTSLMLMSEFSLDTNAEVKISSLQYINGSMPACSLTSLHRLLVFSLLQPPFSRNVRGTAVSGGDELRLIYRFCSFARRIASWYRRLASTLSFVASDRGMSSCLSVRFWRVTLPVTVEDGLPVT
jgi:hypothetical protein